MGEPRRYNWPCHAIPPSWLHRLSVCLGIHASGRSRSAGLSLQRAMGVSPGFQSDHILAGQILLPWADYSEGARLAFVEKLMDNVGHLPGVLSAGVVNNVPFSGHSGKSAATVAGHVLRPGESARGHYSYGVAGDYFRTMGFSLRAGRFLTAADSHRLERVWGGDEDFARYYSPKGSAVAQRFT